MRVLLIAAAFAALSIPVGRATAPGPQDHTGLLKSPSSPSSKPTATAKAAAPKTQTEATAPAKKKARHGDKATIFTGFGAWLDMYAYDAADPERTAATMARSGVRTFYIETGTSYTKYGINPKVGPWLAAAHRHGIEVVGWYLPSYRNFERDVRRAVAVGSYTYRGHRFDGLGLDIEDRSVYKNPHTFARRAWKHARAVRKALGPDYPIASIPPTPLQMRVAPEHWAGFPWRQLARYTDSMLLMSYWTDRVGCPNRKPVHCPYPFTVNNVKLTRKLTGGTVQVHVIGGLTGRMGVSDVRDFVRGALAAKADGASLYEVTTTKRAWWKLLEPLGALGKP